MFRPLCQTRALHANLPASSPIPQVSWSVWNSGYSGSDPASNINNLRSDKIVRALAATAAVDAEAAVDGHALRAG